MKLNNIKDVQKFLAAVNACENDVYLKSVEGDVFNLKSSLSQYIAIGRLIEDAGESLELFAQTREDEAKLLAMMCELGKYSYIWNPPVQIRTGGFFLRPGGYFHFIFHSIHKMLLFDDFITKHRDFAYISYHIPLFRQEETSCIYKDGV